MHSLTAVRRDFRAAQRGEAEQGKLGLQLTDIVPPQGEIVCEVSRTGAMRFMDGQRTFQQGSLQLEHVRRKGGQLRGELFKQRLIQDLHRVRTPVLHAIGKRERGSSCALDVTAR